MATLAVQSISRAGIVPSYTTASAADEFPNDGNVLLHVKNGSGSPTTVTITTPATVDGVEVADLAISVAASAEKMIGPFPTWLFNAADGNVDLACSPFASITLAALKLPRS